MNHIKGPWHVESEIRYGRTSYITINGEEAGYYEMELMNAAPELLEALKAAAEHLEYCGYGDSYERFGATQSKLPEKIASAIAKAEGAPSGEVDDE